VAEDLTEPVERLRKLGPDSLVYLGLGMSSRGVALALAALDWKGARRRELALMFGYAKPEWRDGWADGSTSTASPTTMPCEAACGAVEVDGGRAGRLRCLLTWPAARRSARSRQHLTRDGVRDGLESVKHLPATCGREGTLMGFGYYDHAALKGEYLSYANARRPHRPVDA